MTINHFIDNTDINVYFHMKNHYKRLRNVKSVIDTSIPKGFTKLSNTPPSSGRSWKTCSCEESITRELSHMPIHSNNVRRHNCIKSELRNDSSVRSSSLPPRPKTRRHPYEMPSKSQCKSRSQSVGLTSRKDISSDPHRNKIRKRKMFLKNKNNDQKDEPEKEQLKTEIVINREVPSSIPSEDTNKSTNSQKVSPITSEKTVSKSRTDEHEYLQFLLRITEDIIINNFYTIDDLEKVFRNHVEANRDRLKMEIMEAQLNRLCKELHIPCETANKHVKNEDCYPNFFENNKNDPNYIQTPENCECTANRVLEIDHKKLVERELKIENNDSETCLQNPAFVSSMVMLMNRHSLGRVTECSEPTHSTETLTNSIQQSSVTTVSSFEHVGVLPCLEIPDNGNLNKKNNICEKEGCGELSEMFEREPLLTEKEKIGCAEEEIFYEKYKESSSQKHNIENNINLNENPSTNTENFIKENTFFVSTEKNFLEKTDIRKKHLSELGDITDKENSLYSPPTIKDNSIICLSNTQNTQTDRIIELNKNLPACDTVDPIGEKIKITNVNTPKSSFDKGTQIEVSHSDKECNTDNFNECPITDDYILINGPVFLPRAALTTNENVIFHYKSVNKTVNTEIFPEKLLKNKTVPFNYSLCTTEFDSCPAYLRKNRYSKLLNSDYDLTPQRDNSCNKYQLVDASTSATSLIAKTDGATNLNPGTLLLTEKYSLHREKENQEIEHVQKDDDQSDTSRYEHNNYEFSTNELSSDGQYEIKSYTMPKEVNGFVELSGYSIVSEAERNIRIDEKTTELDVSLTAYEIKSESSDLSKQEIGGGVTGKMKQLTVGVNRGNVSSTDEGSYQWSSVRSEKSQNSSFSAATYTKNVLGKRKLEHPS